MTDDQVMTVDDVASYLKMDKQTVQRMAAKGQLPATKVGREWRFKKSYLDAILDEELKKKLCGN